MKKGTLRTIIIAILLILISIIVNQYNTLVTLDEQVKTQRSQVETLYQRRADLIPNIVATVKGEANFEQETLQRVIEARASATQIKVENTEDLQKFAQAQGELTQALGKLMMLTENYPNLKANQAFSDLRVQLEGSENRISVERMKYNTTAKSYNIKIRMFPSYLFAKLFGFDRAVLFESSEGAKQAPQVGSML